MPFRVCNTCYITEIVEHDDISVLRVWSMAAQIYQIYDHSEIAVLVQ